MKNPVFANVYVDYWDDHEVSDCIHFLTKVFPFMSNKLNNNWKCPIYSSRLNIVFLSKFTDVNRELLLPLNFNKKTDISRGNIKFTATAINSKQFTGHVIYHFECMRKRYMYFGNTCLSPVLLRDLEILFKDNIIDILYLDSTYLQVSQYFSLESATREIIKLLGCSNNNIIMALRPLEMEDLLVNIASKGYSVHIGPRRLQLLELQGANVFFTSSKDVNLRIVDKEHCEDIDRCYRRSIEKKILTIIPSALYTINEAEELKKVGVQIICYADAITSTDFRNLLKVIKIKQLVGIDEKCDQIFLNNFLKCTLSSISSNNLFMPSMNAGTDFEDREEKDHSLAPNDVQYNSENFNNSISSPSEMFIPQVPLKKTLFSKNKNIDHLYTNTQDAFIPLASSSQRLSDSIRTGDVHVDGSELLAPSAPSSISKPLGNIVTSQNNMNRFVKDYVNDVRNHKNKLNRLHLVNLFAGNSMNRTASISKSKHLVEKCVQTDAMIEDTHFTKDELNGDTNKFNNQESLLNYHKKNAEYSKLDGSLIDIVISSTESESSSEESVIQNISTELIMVHEASHVTTSSNKLQESMTISKDVSHTNKDILETENAMIENEHSTKAKLNGKKNKLNNQNPLKCHKQNADDSKLDGSLMDIVISCSEPESSSDESIIPNISTELIMVHETFHAKTSSNKLQDNMSIVKDISEIENVQDTFSDSDISSQSEQSYFSRISEINEELFTINQLDELELMSEAGTKNAPRISSQNISVCNSDDHDSFASMEDDIDLSDISLIYS
ncbi:uncharacterized protein LOC113377243 [Ctenocephalides felis]|uniref:uncharacterized protein LOC113377243 n=1 Tax=Ctenocephalides felis TaxID=7515 RepID=UPI000E6E59E8|nr:uncharacterized protein LOC113377243 [Ctenocephalides felis]